jgi:small multidrug resistance pump
MRWFLLALAIGLEVTASLALQAAGGLTSSPWLIVVAIGYTASFILLGKVLGMGIPVGVAYAIWGAAGVALTALLAHLLLDGPLNLTMGAGLALIIGGVVAVDIGAQRAARESTQAET